MDLDPNMLYTFEVRAVNAIGDSDPASVSTGEPALPALMVTVGAADESIAEGGTTMITATASRDVVAADGAVTVSLSVVGEATLSAHSITIAAGARSDSVTLTSTADADYEDDTVTVTASGTRITGNQEVTITVTDLEPAEALSVTVSAAPPTIAEGGTSTITAMANRAVMASDEPVTVSLRVVGEATLDMNTITIAAGQMSGTATLTSTADEDYENDTVTVVATGTEIAADHPNVEITVTDPEPAAALSVTVSAAPTTIAEGGTSTITAMANRAVMASDEPVTVNLTVAPTDGAELSADSITIAADQMSGTVTLTATDDDDDYEDETVTVVASGTGITGNQSVPITVTDSDTRPTTTDTSTDADVKSISIEGEEAHTIGGTRRLHLMEGDRTELSITLDWNVQQLRDIYEADSTPSSVMVYFAVREAAGADWLSSIDLTTGDGRDVLAVTDAVSVKIPTKPKDTANANTRVSSAPGKVRFAILEDDDAEDEAFSIEVLANESMGVSTRTTSGNKLMSGTYVIDDDETQGVKIKRTSKGTIYETGDDQEFEISADPEMVDLDLEVRLDLTNADDSAVSRAYGVSPTTGTIVSGGKIEATVDVDNNDGNRIDDDLELHAEIISRNRDDIEDASLEFTVLDVHKLPKLMVSPMEGMVEEGDEFELTLTLDRNPRDTRAVSSETRQYTLEAVDVMLSGGAGTTAGMSDYRLPATVKFEEHSGKASDGWTQEMKVKVMALEDDDLDDGEMLVLDAMVAGTKTANGDDKMAYTGLSSLTIGEGTGKLVWALSPEEVEAAVMAAKKEGMGDDMMFTAGEMIELEGNDLFGSAEGVSVGYTAMVEGDAVSESVSGGVVTITADSMGMAKVTITARASRPSGAVTINDQTDPREASITIALEVGLVALSIELKGPDDMNLVEGGMGGMVTATANREVTEEVTVMLMRDRAMSTASDDDFMADPIVIGAGMKSGSTMVMAVEDNMMESVDNMAEELVLYGMAADNAGEVTGQVKLYIWDAAVPALPVIAQLLLAAFLALGGFRRFRRR